MGVLSAWVTRARNPDGADSLGSSRQGRLLPPKDSLWPPQGGIALTINIEEMSNCAGCAKAVEVLEGLVKIKILGRVVQNDTPKVQADHLGQGKTNHNPGQDSFSVIILFALVWSYVQNSQRCILKHTQFECNL